MAATAPGFCISVKLNSSDFQQGGFSNEDCLQVVKWLGEASVDLIEIPGGNYEKPAMMAACEGEHRAARPTSSTCAADQAGGPCRSCRPAASAPSPRWKTAWPEGRLRDDRLAGRCVDTDPPIVFWRETDRAEAYEERIVLAKAGLGWLRLQLIAHGDGRDARPRAEWWRCDSRLCRQRGNDRGGRCRAPTGRYRATAM